MLGTRDLCCAKKGHEFALLHFHRLASMFVILKLRFDLYSGRGIIKTVFRYKTQCSTQDKSVLYIPYRNSFTS
jgi:hypothetical protein